MFRISKIQTFESNSQLFHIWFGETAGCSEYQRYKLLKAIHNYLPASVAIVKLFRISKIQTFESNSQQICSVVVLPVSCSEYQRYKLLKAIHNDLVCEIDGKIVVQNIKDTNFWKQFTTDKCVAAGCSLLFRISKIQTFESNSQLKSNRPIKKTSCSEYQRYKLLKAIHNDHFDWQSIDMVVQNIKDTNFWKQFTTRWI